MPFIMGMGKRIKIKRDRSAVVFNIDAFACR
jgi:hypothetical protein